MAAEPVAAADHAADGLANGSTDAVRTTTAVGQAAAPHATAAAVRAAAAAAGPAAQRQQQQQPNGAQLPRSQSPALEFEVLAQQGRARASRLTLRHGVCLTPMFMPVGTQGAPVSHQFGTKFLQAKMASSGAWPMLTCAFDPPIRRI